MDSYKIQIYSKQYYMFQNRDIRTKASLLKSAHEDRDHYLWNIDKTIKKHLNPQKAEDFVEHPTTDIFKANKN